LELKFRKTEAPVVYSKRLLAVLLAAACAMSAGPALAHHVMGGAMPQTFGQGFLSGLGHPVIGPDHFAAVMGVGLLAALTGQGLGLILLFSACMTGGVGLHLLRLNIPAAELLVALTTLALGVFILGRSLSRLAVSVLIAAAGIVHGYALGESIVGAEPAPLYAYLAGLCVIQALVSAAAMLLARRISTPGWALRLAGVAIVTAGAAFAVQAAGLLA
jgi:urease accessory protein